MAEKMGEAYAGLLVIGQFAKLVDASFKGATGERVERSVLTVHDSVGMQYVEIGAVGNEAAVMAADLRNLVVGDRLAVRVRVSKSGALAYVGLVG